MYPARSSERMNKFSSPRIRQIAAQAEKKFAFVAVIYRGTIQK